MIKLSRRKTDKPDGQRNNRADKAAKKKARKSEPRLGASPLPGRSVITLTGASGGVGTTTAACALAHELTRRHIAPKPYALPKVCLIDLDFDGGSCAYHLDTQATLDPADLARPPSQIDPTFVSALCSQPAQGIALIAAPFGAASRVQADPRSVLAMLDAASQIFDHVIVDLPRQARAFSPAVIAGSDLCLHMAELTVPSLHMMREREMALYALGASERLVPVIGKYERRGGRGALALKDAERALGQPAFATLCADPDPLREAINCGEPIQTIAAEARYLKDIRSLCDVIARALPQSLEDNVDNTGDENETAQAA